MLSFCECTKGGGLISKCSKANEAVIRGPYWIGMAIALCLARSHGKSGYDRASDPIF